MRFFTGLSAVILAAAGAYCFAFYMNGYAGVAFILGAALILYGLCHVISYAIGFRKSLLSEAMFVDGSVSLALGLMAIADMIPDGSFSIYFGFGLMTSGLCRFCEALAVSKVNPRNWFAVVPLSIINTVFGAVLLIPGFLEDLDDLYSADGMYTIDDLYIIAVALILQAFSVAIYTIYMIKRTESAKAKEARERAEAKKLAAEAQRRERDRLRSLSEAERESELEEARLAKVKEAEAKAEARQAKKEARRPASERTLSFTPAETAEIVSRANKIEEEFVFPEPEEEQPATKPVFNKPVNIPTIEKEVADQTQKTDELNVNQKRALVNLEKIEDEIPELDLPKLELVAPELKSSGGESLNRSSIISELKRETVPVQKKEEDLSSFTPLTLEDLFSAEDYAIKPLSDSKSQETDLRLTQTFTFDWLDTRR